MDRFFAVRRRLPHLIFPPGQQITMTEIVVARVQQEVGQDGLNPFDSGNRVLGALAIVDAEIRIVVILMFTTNADDTAIRKLRTR